MKRPDIEAIEARAGAATAGPWSACAANKGRCPCGLVWAADEQTCVTESEAGAVFRHGPQVAVDAAFIAHARQDIPDLIAYVRELEAVVEAARGLSLALDSRLPREQRQGERDPLRAALSRLDGESNAIEAEHGKAVR